MGIHGFKLSDMIPNSWFYKLKDTGTKSSRNDVSKLKKTEQQQQGRRAQTSHQHSVTRIYDNPDSSVSPSDLKLFDTRYFPVPSPPTRSTRHWRMDPRKSRKKKAPRLVTSSVSSGCGCRATIDSVLVKTEPISLPGTEFSVSPSSDSDSFSFSSVDQPPQLPPSFDQMISWSASRSSNDIVIDLGKSSPEPDIDFPPKKPLKFTDMVKNVRRQEEDQVSGVKKSSVRGFVVNPPGVRIHINSNSTRTGPRKRTKGSHRRSGGVLASSSSTSGPENGRTSVPESVAIVKCSADPRRDFRESMVEMIVENNIMASRDLEELLACYLCLNSDEYHDVIISVFRQIWFDLRS